MSDSIKVAIRVRPLIKREVKQGNKITWRVSNVKQITQVDPPGLSFHFDRVFDTFEDNQVVYEDLCSPLVEAAMSGFNGTIFAYGQTSSGKTYTMNGESGIIKNAVEDMFTAIDNMPERTFLIRVSYMELYNEILIDLTDSSRKELQIKEDADGVINVVGLKETEIKSSADVFQVLKIGERQRSIAATHMNERSSRSHTILRMIVESRSCNGDLDEDVCVAHLNLVDLAGSEKTAQHKSGARFKEGVNINKSLLTLTKVINQLSEADSKHVSYRDSKLTRILQNSLGGNAHTVIICTVTPASYDCTVSTLKFADRAKRIKNKPVVNVVSTDVALLKKYDQEIRKLTVELQVLQKQNEPQVLQKLEETSKQNEDLKLQIKALKEKFLVSQFKENRLPTITKVNRRETWCFGLQNRMRAPIDACSSNLLPLPILKEECSPTRKSDSDLEHPYSSLSKNSSDVPSPEGNKFCTSSTQTEEPFPQESEELKGVTVKMTKALGLMSSRKHNVEQELKELKEFTTLEKQFYCEDDRNIMIESLKEENRSLKDSLQRMEEELELLKQSSTVEMPVLKQSSVEQVVQVTPWIEVTHAVTMNEIGIQTEEEKETSPIVIEQAIQASLLCDAVKEKYGQADLNMILEESETSGLFEKLSSREQGVQVSFCAEVSSLVTLHEKGVQVEENSTKQSVESNNIGCLVPISEVPLQKLVVGVNNMQSVVHGFCEKLESLPAVVRLLLEKQKSIDAAKAAEVINAVEELLVSVQSLVEQRARMKSDLKTISDVNKKVNEALIKSVEQTKEWKDRAFQKQKEFKENVEQSKELGKQISAQNALITQYRARNRKLLQQFGQVEQIESKLRNQIDEMFESLRKDFAAMKKQSKQKWHSELQRILDRINQKSTECGVQLKQAHEKILQCSKQMAKDMERVNSSVSSVMNSHAETASAAAKDNKSLMANQLKEAELKCESLESEKKELISELARLKEQDPNAAMEIQLLKLEVQNVTEKYHELQARYLEKDKQLRTAMVSQTAAAQVLQHENRSVHRSEDIAKDARYVELQLEKHKLQKRLMQLEEENGSYSQKISSLKAELRRKQQDDDVTISLVPNRAASIQENKENREDKQEENRGATNCESPVHSASLRLSLDKDTSSECRQQ